MTTTTTRQKASIANEIYGIVRQAEVGSFVRLDNGRCLGEKLLAGDDFTCPGWEGCDFRFPNPINAWRETHAIGCNVHVTGRTFRNVGGSLWVRVQIEWVGDCEENTFCGGYMLIS